MRDPYAGRGEPRPLSTAPDGEYTYLVGATHHMPAIRINGVWHDMTPEMYGGARPIPAETLAKFDRGWWTMGRL